MTQSTDSPTGHTRLVACGASRSGRAEGGSPDCLFEEEGDDEETARLVALAIPVFYAAAVLFLLNFALGLLVQFRVVDTKPFRWLHHALFFAVFVSAAAAALAGFLSGAPYRWTLLPVLALFAVLPRVRAGTAGHAALACCALLFYAVSFVWIL